MLPGAPAARVRACTGSTPPQLPAEAADEAQELGSLSSRLRPGQFWVLGREPLDEESCLCLFQNLLLSLSLGDKAGSKPPRARASHKGALPPRRLSA